MDVVAGTKFEPSQFYVVKKAKESALSTDFSYFAWGIHLKARSSRYKFVSRKFKPREARNTASEANKGTSFGPFWGKNYKNGSFSRFSLQFSSFKVTYSYGFYLSNQLKIEMLFKGFRIGPLTYWTKTVGPIWVKNCKRG